MLLSSQAERLEYNENGLALDRGSSTGRLRKVFQFTEMNDWGEKKKKADMINVGK